LPQLVIFAGATPLCLLQSPPSPIWSTPFRCTPSRPICFGRNFRLTVAIRKKPQSGHPCPQLSHIVTARPMSSSSHAPFIHRRRGLITENRPFWAAGLT